MRQSDLSRFGFASGKKQSEPEKSPDKVPVIGTRSKQNSENPSPVKKVGEEPVNHGSPKSPIK